MALIGRQRSAQNGYAMVVGTTPTMLTARPLRVIERPMTPRSPPNCDRHSRSESTAASPRPAAASSLVKNLPMSGVAPNVLEVAWRDEPGGRAQRAFCGGQHVELAANEREAGERLRRCRSPIEKRRIRREAIITTSRLLPQEKEPRRVAVGKRLTQRLVCEHGDDGGRGDRDAKRENGRHREPSLF